MREIFLDKRIPFKNKSYLLTDDYTPDLEQGQQLGYFLPELPLYAPFAEQIEAF